MRKFKCYDCAHAWEIPHGQGGRGIDQACPKCGSRNVHRENRIRGFGYRRGRQNQADKSE